MKNKVMVFGSFVVDLSSRADRLPTPGRTVRGSSFQMGPGGKGFNQAVAAHKSGADVVTVTKIGKDNFGAFALDTAKTLHMNTEHIIQSDTESTGAALICVDETTAENQILIVPGACESFTEDEIEALVPTLQSCDFVLLQHEVNQDANEKMAQLAHDNNVKVILNPAPVIEFDKNILHHVALITPNETEAEGLTGITVSDLDSARAAKDQLLTMGVEEVVITLGTKGAYIYNSEFDEIIPAYTVEAVDSTGAGDAFNGGLLTALSRGETLKDAAHFATAVAALAVQKRGTAVSMPTEKEIEDFLKTMS
ncbi:ribokinase [Peptoniphilus equinus]|uniref:Ribokinase n=1 Tax=Peptoniphilus equinus TaxID=3016343 RepID=A0ABY7QV83_9FIRM|nr:ribokinase [Peptoniphilus equinus]WBW50704.1 ribokinase [Peptoniphilus equinus]